jgi:hypothetical protein
MSIVRGSGHAKRARRSPYLVNKAIVEVLESRILLNNYVVSTNAGDNSGGSLRSEIGLAVAQADSSHQAQAITFNGVTGSINLENYGALNINNTSGSVIIQGPGATVLSITAGGHSGVFFVASNANAEIEDLTITGGTSSVGGGISNRGVLEVVDSTITGNSAIATNAGIGGGILNQGHLTLTGSTVSDNYADGYGAGIWNDSIGNLTITLSNLTGNTCVGKGGGVYDLGTLTASQTTLSGNSANDGGGLYNYGATSLADCTISDNSSNNSGGGIHNKSGSGLTITDSTISGNSAGRTGGGIDNEAALNVTYTTISDNSAVYNGGGISTDNSYAVTIDHCTISGNTTSNSGGGLYNNGSDVSLTNSTLSDNTANHGGGIGNASTLSVSNSTISGNGSSGGGGIYNSATALLYLNDSTVSGNTTASDTNGAGLYNYGGTAAVSGSTFVDNTVSGFAYGGGIANWNDGSVTLANSTVADNSSRQGAGIDSDSGSLVLTDCTISGNVGSGSNASGVFCNGGYNNNDATCSINGTLVAGNTAHDLVGAGFSGSDNFIGNGSGDLTGSTNHSGTISLSSLGYYGGPTETIVPLPMTGAGNPAMGDGDPSTGLTTDQRGMPRPVSGSYDIGAFQTQGTNSLVVNTLLDDPVGAGKLSLRDAINLADALGGNQTITFESGMSGTIFLTQGVLAPDDTSGTLTIQGPTTGNITISAGGSGDIFQIASGSTASIDNLTITDAYSAVGAVSKRGSLPSGRRGYAQHGRCDWARWN